jgi:hypothetical protein
MKNKETREIVQIIGYAIIGLAVLLTIAIISGKLPIQALSSALQMLAFVKFSPDGSVVVGGLSDTNAMLFGGILIASMYLFGSGIIIKTRR